MYVTGLCFDDSAQGAAAHHDLLVVVISYLVAASASFTALQMIERLQRTEGRSRAFWRFGAATVLGGGVWSMHFIGMLACKTPFAVAYLPGLTALSGVIAVAVVWFGLKMFEKPVTSRSLAEAGCVIGLGVAAMHYLGMQGLSFAGHIAYRPLVFAASILIALTAAVMALWLAYRLVFQWQRALAAAIMGAAVCGMHYVAMAGTVFVLDPTMPVPQTAVSREMLILGVTVGVVLVVMSGLLCALLDRRLEAWAEQEAARLRTLNDALETRTRELEVANRDADAANRAKSAFLATMSHEIRTPLNGVLGMAQAMEADELTPIQRTRLDVIRQSGQALLAILNDVLDLSKIEAGKIELEEIEFDISTVVLGAHAAFTAIAQKNGLSFDLEIDPDTRGGYRGDPTRIRQILYNLISNALKFTETGGVRVTVVFEDEMLKLSVKDTGIGMTTEQTENLFQKFAQADASMNRLYGGTGLGLAICYQLAAVMNGTILASSQKGVGSTFTFALPLTRLAQAAAPSTSAGGEPEPRLTSGVHLRVLAAEDNAINQLVLKTLLAQAGINPFIVVNGAEAVEAWSGGAWDVILMDMQMPVMDGLEATKAIRSREGAEGRTHTPIIALTANAMTHQVAQYRDAGIDAHVAKPVAAASLFEAINLVLSALGDPSGAADPASWGPADQQPPRRSAIA